MPIPFFEEAVFENVHQLLKRLRQFGEQSEFYSEFKQAQQKIVAEGDDIARKQAENKLQMLEDLRTLLPTHPLHLKPADAVRIRNAYILIGDDLMKSAVWDCFEAYCYNPNHPLLSGPTLEVEMEELKRQKITNIIDGAFLHASVIQARTTSTDGKITGNDQDRKVG